MDGDRGGNLTQVQYFKEGAKWNTCGLDACDREVDLSGGTPVASENALACGAKYLVAIAHEFRCTRLNVKLIRLPPSSA